MQRRYTTDAKTLHDGCKDALRSKDSLLQGQRRSEKKGYTATNTETVEQIVRYPFFPSTLKMYT